MPTRAPSLADQLLDLQVEFVIGELTGTRFTEVVTRDVTDLLRLVGPRPVAEVADAEQVKASLRRAADVLSTSPVVADLAVAAAEAIYQLPTNSTAVLGEIVDREAVEALVDAVLALSTLHDRAMDRMAQSPLVGAVAAQFVTRIVGDFLQQNRQLAEKVPGVSSLFSIGLGAASKVRSVTVDQFLGDAAGKGGQFAIRRTNAAIRDLLRTAPLRGAAMEVWDLHATETLSELRAYLSAAELRELVGLVLEILVTAGGTDFAGQILDACVDAFFTRHGGDDVATLLSGLGIGSDDLVSAVVRHVGPVLQSAHARGELDALIRARLAPFYDTPEVRALLDGADTTDPSRPGEA